MCLASMFYLQYLYVATVPTACGIETLSDAVKIGREYLVATVPTACGIETYSIIVCIYFLIRRVATVPTACGIETILYSHSIFEFRSLSCNSTYRLRY